MSAALPASLDRIKIPPQTRTSLEAHGLERYAFFAAFNCPPSVVCAGTTEFALKGGIASRSASVYIEGGGRQISLGVRRTFGRLPDALKFRRTFAAHVPPVAAAASTHCSRAGHRRGVAGCQAIGGRARYRRFRSRR